MNQLGLPENYVTIFRGQSKTLIVTVLNPADGKPLILDGASIYFTVRLEATEDAPVLIQKSTADALQVDITDSRRGVAEIYLIPTDTSGLDLGNYVFDVWAILPTGEQFPVITPSVFQIQAGVTRLP